MVFINIMNHIDLLKNVSDFYDRLPTTSIIFIWKAGRDTWISQEAAVLKMNKKEYFLRQNANNISNQDAFYYAYSKNGITFLLGAYKVQKDPVILYNHSILKKCPNATANQGDHLTFGLSKLASMRHTKVSTHRTRYEHNPSNPNIIDADHDSYCNFSFIESNLKNFRSFQNQMCFKTTTEIKKVHSKDDQHLIHKYCKEAMIKKKPIPVIGGVRRFFGEYKGVHYRSSAFTDYITFSLKLERLHTLTDFFIIYDQDKNVDNPHPHMIAVIEFEAHLFYIYIHTRRIMKASYAFSKNRNGFLCTKQENKCLEKMNANFKDVCLKIGI